MGTYGPRKPIPPRVPPRRRKPRRTVLNAVVLPALKTGILVLIVVIVSAAIINKIARPFKLWNREDREVRQVAAELSALRKENVELERRLRYLKTPEGVAQAARRLGWVKPGEVSLVLPEEDAHKSYGEQH